MDGSVGEGQRRWRDKEETNDAVDDNDDVIKATGNNQDLDLGDAWIVQDEIDGDLTVVEGSGCRWNDGNDKVRAWSDMISRQ